MKDLKIVESNKLEEKSCSVNVYTEWAPLREVVVGSCINFNMQGIDNLFRFLYDNRDGRFYDKKEVYEVSEQFITERQEDLDNIQRVLEARGIKVRRPNRLENIPEIITPTFESVATACDSPRDMYLAIGTEIIETPPTNRKRYFEHILLQDIFMDYFRSGAKWTVAPRPTLSDNRIDFSFWQENVNEPIGEFNQIGKNYEIAFDAANCLKFGKDIVMNVGTKNHELGAIWLQRHLEDRFKVHPIRICDDHLDGTFVPLAPGKLLVNERVMNGQYHRLPAGLQKWDRIPIMDPAEPFKYPARHLQMASYQGMTVNVLSLDEKVVLIRDTAKRTIDELYRRGFEPIPVQLRHCELFGGSIHCCTVDIRRDEKQENHF